MDDRETWQVLADGRIGGLFAPDEEMATQLFKLLEPRDLNTLALTLALLRERAEGFHGGFNGLFAESAPTVPAGGLSEQDEEALMTVSSRQELLEYFGRRSRCALEEAPEWVVQLAARCFDHWDSFAAKFWTLSQELQIASQDYFDANLIERDHGPPLPPLFYSRSVALHQAAAVYKHAYLFVHYGGCWGRVGGGAE